MSVGIDRRRSARDREILQPARIEIGIHHGHLLVAGRALAAAAELGIAVDRVDVGGAPVHARGLDLLEPLGVFGTAHHVRRENDQQLGAAVIDTGRSETPSPSTGTSDRYGTRRLSRCSLFVINPPSTIVSPLAVLTVVWAVVML